MNLSKHRVLVMGIVSPFLALVLNTIVIQALLAFTSNPESNWRFRLIVSSLVLPVPFVVTLMLALRGRQSRVFSLSAKIGLGIATLSLLLIAKPLMDGFTRSKQSRNMELHNVPAPIFDTLDIHGTPQRLADSKGKVVLVICCFWNFRGECRDPASIPKSDSCDLSASKDHTRCTDFLPRYCQVSGDIPDRPRGDVAVSAKRESGIRKARRGCGRSARRAQLTGRPQASFLRSAIRVRLGDVTALARLV